MVAGLVCHWLRGLGVMQGSLDKEVSTARAFRGGDSWFDTGGWFDTGVWFDAAVCFDAGGLGSGDHAGVRGR